MARRRLSREIERKLAAIQSDRVVIAAVKTIAHSDAAMLKALRLTLVAGALIGCEPRPPEHDRGLHARRNLDGWRERRTDMPMVDRDVSHWAPNWHGSGSHLVSRTIKAYPVKDHPARLLTVTSTVLEQLDRAAVVRVRVDQPLERAASGFAEDLQFNLSLLREVCGVAHVFPADMTDQEYANIQHVAWELLPPGALDRVIARVKAVPTTDPARSGVAEERLRALNRLRPDGFIQGRGRFSSYFGAMFGENVVALENLDYGNALYLFEADWKRLSQLSRTELVKRRDAGVWRVQHRAGWQPIVRSLVRKARPGAQHGSA